MLDDFFRGLLIGIVIILLGLAVYSFSMAIFEIFSGIETLRGLQWNL
jgi:hypothetical protein